MQQMKKRYLVDRCSIMIKKYLLISFLLISSICSAQCHEHYVYDAGGKRIQRYYVSCRPELQEPEEPIIKYGINVFPNPTSSSVNITISNFGDNDKALLLLYDMQGKEVFKRETYAAVEKVDLSSLPNGDYFLKIIINGEKASYKIQKLE
jgi:hypothetical protein